MSSGEIDHAITISNCDTGGIDGGHGPWQCGAVRARPASGAVAANEVVDDHRVGVVGNADLPHILCDADVAVFPNRCEGGTNLALMECMASGIPCIVSMNSGHLDIATADNCLPLHQQSPANDPNGFRHVWGESDIDEIVAQLESAYMNREAVRGTGLKGVERMRQMTWANQIGTLVRSFES